MIKDGEADEWGMLIKFHQLPVPFLHQKRLNGRLMRKHEFNRKMGRFGELITLYGEMLKLS